MFRRFVTFIPAKMTVLEEELIDHFLTHAMSPVSFHTLLKTSDNLWFSEVFRRYEEISGMKLIVTMHTANRPSCRFTSVNPLSANPTHKMVNHTQTIRRQFVSSFLYQDEEVFFESNDLSTFHFFACRA